MTQCIYCSKALRKGRKHICTAPRPPDLAAIVAAQPFLAKKVDTTTEVLTERGKRYGKFEGHARITQALKECMQAHEVEREDPQIPRRTWDTLDDDMRESLEMIAHKVGRILNGDPRYHDSWVDIAGYAQLVADRLKGVTQ